MNSLLNSTRLMELVTVGMASLFSTLIADQIMKWFITSNLIIDISMRTLIMSLLGAAVCIVLVTFIVRILRPKEN